jgi:enoyl-CoA hydratase/carnithine racemase
VSSCIRPSARSTILQKPGSLTERSVYDVLPATEYIEAAPKGLVVDDVVHVERRMSASGAEYAVLTLSRPDQMNPLDYTTVQVLEHVLRDVLAQDRMRGVVITGAPPAFSAGGDLKGYVSLYQDDVRFAEFLEYIGRVNEILSSSRLVSIAAVNGVCVAGGLEIVLACDLMVMSETAMLSDGHLKYWQLPGGGGTQRLPRAIGAAPARAMLLTGDAIDADEAHRLGLAYQVCADQELLASAFDLMERIVQAPSLTIERVKQLITHAENEPLDSGLAHERAVVAQYVSGADNVASKGLQRFLERKAGVVEG